MIDKTPETSYSSAPVLQETVLGTSSKVSQIVRAIPAVYDLGGEIAGLESFSGGLETQKWTFQVNGEQYLLKVYGDVGVMFGQRYAKYRIINFVKIERRLKAAGVPVAETIETRNGELIALVAAKGLPRREYEIAFSVMRTFPGRPLENPSEGDVKNVIQRIMTKIHTLNFSVPPSHDSWSVLRFKEEYDRNRFSQYPIVNEASRLTGPTVEKFSQLDLSDEGAFPRTPIHADLHSNNILKSSDGRLCLLDFGCFGTGPRIADLAIFMAFTCPWLNDPEKTKRNFDLAVSEYNKIIELTSEERKALPVLVRSCYAMFALRASRALSFEPNDKDLIYWRNFGIRGLGLANTGINI